MTDGAEQIKIGLKNDGSGNFRSRFIECSVRHSVQVQYSRCPRRCQVTWRDYLCVISPIKLLLHRNWENGPGGIRTRIYDLDRVSCCHYTTGPGGSLRDAAGDRKTLNSNFRGCVSHWDTTYGCAPSRGLNEVKHPVCPRILSRWQSCGRA